MGKQDTDLDLDLDLDPLARSFAWVSIIGRRREILELIFRRCVPENGCLVWTGPNSGDGRGGGYGRFSFEGRTACTHRTVWAAIHGPIPPRKQIDHTCGNRLCCNPSHLQLTTHKRNQKLRDERNTE